MTKKDGSRFDNFINAARAKQTPDPSPSDEAAPTQETLRLSKSSDPNYMRTTVYLPRQIHRRLKSNGTEIRRIK